MSLASLAPASRSRTAVLAVAAGTLVASGIVATPHVAVAQGAASTVEIPYEEFTLPNGLRVIVHTDRKAPIVAVNLWYHVGSKNEARGRSGFAHLFEHLMFNGSENHPGEFFEPFELVGATDQNGTTNQDRTNYFQNVPTTALDMALWMESDRMGHLLGAIDQKTLDEQRGVVQNEKRQGENQPYGRRIFARIFEALYPEDHPYHWQTIGSMPDLNAATLDDVKTWFRSWYGPNNAVLVLAGDIDARTAREKVARYFGDIPASATLADMATSIPRREKDTREVIPDRVPRVRIYRAWPVAEYGNRESHLLQMLSHVLGASASSRLDARLVHGDKLADSVSTFYLASEISGTFLITADVKKDVDPARVEAVVDEELQRLLQEGPTATELEQARTALRADIIRGIERIGGFGGKSDALAECAVYVGTPDCYRDELAVFQRATSADVQAAGRKWLGPGSHVVIVQPSDTPASALPEKVAPAPTTSAALPPPDPKYRTVPSDVDRGAGVPKTTTFPELTWPSVQRATLSNGLQVYLVERHDVPLVRMNLEFPGGFSADVGKKLGTAGFTTAMLDQGAGRYGALELAARKEALGAQIGAGASLDSVNVTLSALTDKLADSLDLLADVVRRPTFDTSEFERVRAQWLARIEQEKARPQAAVLRVMPTLLYGKAHAYAIPFTGSGTTESITSLTRDDLVAFHRDWLQPETARIVVVGDATLKALVPQLEARFGDWKSAPGAPQLPALTTAPRPDAGRVFLIDQPGAVQSNIYVGQLVPPTGDTGTIDFDFANSVLGGEFSSRLNMNLREDKHWAYGSYSNATNARGQRPWMASAAVQSDKTIESIRELQKEIGDFVSGTRPVTDAEVAKIRASNTLSLPGAYETSNAVLNQINSNLRYGRPLDFILQYKARNDAMTPPLAQTAARTLEPKALTWVVVGDLSKIEAGIRSLNLGGVQIVDADGKPVGGKGAEAAAPATKK